MFAKTTDEFYEDEIQLFRKLRKENVPVVLLTNGEMEPYEPYWGKDADNLPARHALTLREMARNSEFRYLRDRQP